MAANNWKRLAVLAVLMVGICFCSACSAVPPVQDNLRFPEITAPELTERETFMVEFGDISTPISGTCELIFPMEEQLCYPYTGARVVAIHVAVGQQVQKGDVLMTLSVNDHQVTLATLRLERERLDQQIGEQKSVLLAQIDEKLQQAQQLGGQAGEIARLEAELLQVDYDAYAFDAQNLLAEADQKIAYYEELAQNNVIVAPFNGEIDYVMKLNAEDEVPAGSTLISLHCTDVFMISMRNVPKSLAYNAPVSILVGKGDSAARYEGRVVTASNVLSSALSQDKVLVELNDPVTAQMLQGTVRYQAQTIIVQNVLIAPRKAFHQDRGMNFVYLMEDGVMRKQYVSVYYTGTDTVWIVDGLEAGQTLIVD